MKVHQLARLTSPEFLRSGIAGIRAELERVRTAPASALELAVLAKHVVGLDESFRLAKEVVEVGHLFDTKPVLEAMLSEWLRVRVGQIGQTESLTSPLSTSTTTSSPLSTTTSSPMHALFTVLLPHPSLVTRFLESLTTDEFFECMQFMISEWKHEKEKFPFTHTIPALEQQVLQRRPTGGAQTSILIKLVGLTKMSHEKIFQIAAKSVLASDLADIRPAVILMLVKEMGYSGFCHSELFEYAAPALANFHNYQALTSVFLMGGGLTRPIVDQSLETIRRDKKRADKSSYPISCHGHAQVIRRLVVCGYLQEAMDLWSHFPPSAFATLTARNELTQIYRLFLASFIDPITVPPTAVACLKRDCVRLESSVSQQHGLAQSSFIHSLVVGALTRLGVDHVSEFVHEETLLVIDVFVPSLNLAIEVQGPSHYITDLATGQTTLRPEDAFKLKVMKAVGLNVELLTVYDFGRNNATRNADAKIAQLLDSYR